MAWTAGRRHISSCHVTDPRRTVHELSRRLPSAYMPRQRSAARRPPPKTWPSLCRRLGRLFFSYVFFKLFYVLLYKLTCSMLNINIHMNIYVVCIFFIYYEYIYTVCIFSSTLIMCGHVLLNIDHYILLKSKTAMPTEVLWRLQTPDTRLQSVTPLTPRRAPLMDGATASTWRGETDASGLHGVDVAVVLAQMLLPGVPLG